MDETKQILRWSIPGWIFLLILAVNYLISKFILYFSNSFLNKNLPDPFGFLSNISENDFGTSIIIIIFGIPLGFIIYQIYNIFHYKYGKNLFNVFEKPDEIVDKNFNNKTKIFTDKLIPYYKNRFFQKDLKFAPIYYCINQKKEPGLEKNVNQEQFFSDLYHSLGTTNFAIKLATLLYSISIFYIYWKNLLNISNIEIGALIFIDMAIRIFIIFLSAIA